MNTEKIYTIQQNVSALLYRILELCIQQLYPVLGIGVMYVLTYIENNVTYKDYLCCFCLLLWRLIEVVCMNDRLRPPYPRRIKPVPIEQEAGWGPRAETDSEWGM
jgi:hypothetical protein